MWRGLRIALGVVVVGSLALPATAYAVRPGDSAQQAETENITTAEGRVVVKSVRGGYIHALSLLCTTAPCEVAVYDSVASGVSNTGVGTLKWEGRVSANNGTYTQDFPVPLVLTNGITVEVAGTGGAAFVAYE